MSTSPPVARSFAADAAANYKLIYLAQRGPALAAEAFAAAWRAHSQLASTFGASLGAHFRSVHQCVKDREDTLPATFDNRHDGAAILAMKSWQDDRWRMPPNVPSRDRETVASSGTGSSIRHAPIPAQRPSNSGSRTGALPWRWRASKR